LLKTIYGNTERSNYLGFKDGTILMFFNDLPQFSIDLDFDLLENARSEKLLKRA